MFDKARSEEQKCIEELCKTGGKGFMAKAGLKRKSASAGGKLASKKHFSADASVAGDTEVFLAPPTRVHIFGDRQHKANRK